MEKQAVLVRTSFGAPDRLRVSEAVLGVSGEDFTYSLSISGRSLGVISDISIGSFRSSDGIMVRSLERDLQEDGIVDIELSALEINIATTIGFRFPTLCRNIDLCQTAYTLYDCSRSRSFISTKFLDSCCRNHWRVPV
jgi:hypothetical protein